MERSQIARLSSPVSLVLAVAICLTAAVSLIMPTAAVAEITVGNTVNGGNNPTYNIVYGSAPNAIIIGPGEGSMYRTPPTDVWAGGIVNTPALSTLPIPLTVFTWNGTLTVESGNRYQLSDPPRFTNNSRASVLNLRSNLIISGGGIVVQEGKRPVEDGGLGKPPENWPSYLQIQLGGNNLSLVGGVFSVTGAVQEVVKDVFRYRGSRVDVGTQNGNNSGYFLLQNVDVVIGGSGGFPIINDDRVNILSSEFRIAGTNFGSGGRINVGAIVDDVTGQFVRGNTIIRALGDTNVPVSGSLGHNLYFYSGATALGGTGTQRIEVGEGATLTLSGNVYADTTDTVNGVPETTRSEVIKLGAGTLAFTGNNFVRSQLLDIQGGTVSFTHSGNIGAGDIRLNGVNTVLSLASFGQSFVRGNITTGISLQLGQLAGGTINVANAGGTMTTTGTITVNGELRKTGSGILNVEDSLTDPTKPAMNRPGLLQIYGGGVRFETQDQLGLGSIRLHGTGASLIYRGGGESAINNAIELSTGGTFRVEQANGTLRIVDKTIRGSGTLVKAGRGTLWLDMTMVAGLSMRIDQGTVRFEERGNLVSGSITFGGVNDTFPEYNAILEYTGTGKLTIDNPMILGITTPTPSGQIAGGQIKVTNAGAILAVDSSITDSFDSSGRRIASTLVKTGDGELVIARPAAFAGEVRIQKGKLTVIKPDTFSSASALVMSANTIFDMTAPKANQTLHGIHDDGSSLGARILLGDNTLTFDLKGEHSFGGELIGSNKSKLVVSAAVQNTVSNNVQITIEPSLTIADVSEFFGSVRLRTGSSQLDPTTKLPQATLIFGSDWKPGVGATITFDLNAGAMPLGADPSPYKWYTNPLGIEVTEGTTDLSNAEFRVWIDPQIKNDRYHAGYIKTVDLDTTNFNPQNRQTLFQTTWVEIRKNDSDTVDVYTNFTGFSGLNAHISDLTENQLQVALNLDRTRIIPSTGKHGIMDIIAAMINAEDNVSTAEAVAGLKDTFTQLSGDIHANAMFLTQSRPWQTAYQQMGIDSQMYFTGAEAISRGELLRGQVPYGYGSDSRPLASMNRIWVTPTYSGTSITSDGNARGGTIDRYGFQMGYDRRINHHATVGGVLGYDQSWLKQSLKQGSEKVQLSDVRLGLYGSAMLGYYIEARGYAGVGLQSYESTRIIDSLKWLGYNSMQATGQTNGWSSSCNLEVARPLFFGRMILRPTIGADCEYASRDAFSEKGDAIALRVGRTTASRIALKGGFAFEAGTMKRVSLNARLFAGGQFGGDDMRTTTQFVGIGAYPVQSIRAVKTGTAFLEGGIGTRVFVNDQRTLAFLANYEGSGSKRLGFHALSCGLTWAY